MKKIIRFVQKWILLIFGIVLGLAVLSVGPLAINYVFLAETTGWNFNLAFSAGEMLQYYGAVLGGLVTCFAIITTVHINNKNRKHDWQKQRFEKTYEIYHKLPEILAKIELTAIHVQYSTKMSEDKLMETLDEMKESESALREHQFANDINYSKKIESILKKIIVASVNCQDNAERFLQDKKFGDKNPDLSHEAMETAFFELRELIKNAKSDIMAEINQFVGLYDENK
jgi:hypothetical protein